MSIFDTFNHDHFTRLWNAGKQKEAEEYRLSFKKSEPETVVNVVDVPEIEPTNEPIMVVHQELGASIEELRSQYETIHGKAVPVRFKNDAEWISTKL